MRFAEEEENSEKKVLQSSILSRIGCKGRRVLSNKPKLCSGLPRRKAIPPHLFPPQDRFPSFCHLRLVKTLTTAMMNDPRT
jgi:hypothetical protein